MLLRHTRTALLSLAIAGLLGPGVMADAQAQGRDRSERQSKQKQEVLYPNATREAPKGKSSSKLGSKLQKMIDVFNKEDYAAARAQADEILADAKANEADKSLAAQIASQSAYSTDDSAAAKTYLQQAIDFNGLDNNGHYQAMFMLAQLQLQDDQYSEGIATLDKYLAETKSTKPEDAVLKGQALYQTERYAEAIQVLKPIVETTPDAKDSWVQILMASYAENNQAAEATALAEKIAAKAPNDKKAQMNLAAMYMQADQMDKAAGVLEKLRASGQLNEEKDYRQLYATYANMDGKEKEVIAVINEGLQKNILKPNAEVYTALAQSYYYSEQIPQALEAWQKAAPLAKDGETYLNLAKVLFQEGKKADAKQAAKSALEKGVKKPEDAKKIIAAP
ncbi:MAG: tetratricopeptide repeat protein [Pseudoxanthomonas sp.]